MTTHQPENSHEPPAHGTDADHATHTDHTGHAAMFRRLFWITLALSVPVIALSTSVEGWFGYDLPGSAWVPPVLGIVVFAVGGRPFLTMARDELSARAPGMMTLISLAIVTAFLASAASTLGIGDMDFWWELAGLIVVMLLGHWQEMRAVGQAQGALSALADLLPDQAERVTNGVSVGGGGDAVAGELGIDRVYAEVKPGDKDQVVGDLQRGGTSVAMVGDGVNDAPALARADVGLAIGAGTDVAMEAADVVLATSDPRAVVAAVTLSQATYRKMIQNLVWATARNAIAVPVAAGAFAWAGVTMPPAAAALAMSASTIVVALNAQLLRRVDLDPDGITGATQASRSGQRAAARA